MHGSVFRLHQLIRRVDSLICYELVCYQAAPSGSLYVLMDLRHLGCDGQVVAYHSNALIAAPVSSSHPAARRSRSLGGGADR